MHRPNLVSRLQDILRNAPNGVLLDKLDSEYHMLHGGHIFLGAHADLESLLRTLTDVCRIHESGSGQKRVFTVSEVGFPATPALNGNSMLAPYTKIHSKCTRSFPSSLPPEPVTIQLDRYCELIETSSERDDLEKSGARLNEAACTRHYNGDGLPNVATQPVRSPTGINKLSELCSPESENRDLPDTMVGCANPWDTLVQLSAMEGLPPPNVRFREGRENKHAATAYLCTLTFKGKPYQSYPEFSSTEAHARDLAAAKVLADLKNKPHVQLPLSPSLAAQPELPRQEMETPEQIENVVVKLLNMLESNPSGMRCDAASRAFAASFGAQLPANWPIKIRGDARVCVVKKGDEEFLCKKRVPIQICSQIPHTVPELAFSAEGETVFITCVISATHFRGLVNKERRNRMEAKLHAFYSQQNIARSLRLNDKETPTVGAYYAALSHKWYRVRCIGGESKSGPAKFHFIDCGAIETILKDKLHHLSNDFFTYPAFSVDFCLDRCSKIAGSDAKDEALINGTKNALLLKEVWLQPGTDCDASTRPLPVTPYTCRKGEEGSELIKIPVIDGDIQTNGPPKIPVTNSPPETFEAYLTNVSEDGTFFLQIEGSGRRILSQQQIEPSGRTPVQKVVFNEIYCALLKKRWARCVVTRILSLAEIGIEFIDYGIEETVSIDKIFTLKLTKLLKELPPQAVRTHLTNVLPYVSWSKGDIAEIMQYCPQDEKLIVEKSAATQCRKRFCDLSIQHVYIYKRNPLFGNQLVPVNAELHRRLRRFA